MINLSPFETQISVKLLQKGGLGPYHHLVGKKSGYVAPVKQNDMRPGEPSPINEKHKNATSMGRWVDVSLGKKNKTGSFLKACDLAFWDSAFLIIFEHLMYSCFKFQGGTTLISHVFFSCFFFDGVICWNIFSSLEEFSIPKAHLDI